MRKIHRVLILSNVKNPYLSVHPDTSSDSPRSKTKEEDLEDDEDDGGVVAMTAAVPCVWFKFKNTANVLILNKLLISIWTKLNNNVQII